MNVPLASELHKWIRAFWIPPWSAPKRKPCEGVQFYLLPWLMLINRCGEEDATGFGCPIRQKALTDTVI